MEVKIDQVISPHFL